MIQTNKRTKKKCDKPIIEKKELENWAATEKIDLCLFCVCLFFFLFGHDIEMTMTGLITWTFYSHTFPSQIISKSEKKYITQSFWCLELRCFYYIVALTYILFRCNWFISNKWFRFDQLVGFFLNSAKQSFVTIIFYWIFHMSMPNIQRYSPRICYKS